MLEYPAALALVALISGVTYMLTPNIARTDSAMLYLLGVLAIAFWTRRGPTIVAALASAAMFDWLFVHPFSFGMGSDTRFWVTLAVMALVGVVVGSLVTEVRDQARVAVEREQRTATLFRLTKTLAAADEADIEAVAGRAVAELLHVDLALHVIDDDGALRLVHRIGDTRDPSGTGSTRPHVLPLEGRHGVIGQLVVREREPADEPEERSDARQEMIGTVASLIAMAIERVRVERARQRAELAAEAERLRSALLASVSHDLRTPLGAILGSVTTLEQEPSLDPSVRASLLAGIHEQAEQLNRILRNLLEMTRLEGDGARLRPELAAIEEPIGTVLASLAHRIGDRQVDVVLEASDGPLFAIFDPIAAELVLSNMLENALRYGADPIQIHVAREQEVVAVRVRDRGAGLDPITLRHAFEKFHRGPRAPSGGAGLGLAIVRILVEASGGRVWARNRDDGPGAEFGFTLPSAERPEIPGESELEANCLRQLHRS